MLRVGFDGDLPPQTSGVLDSSYQRETWDQPMKWTKGGKSRLHVIDFTNWTPFEVQRLLGIGTEMKVKLFIILMNLFID